MPAKTDKQKKIFDAKKGKSGKDKKTVEKVEGEEDEQSVSKQLKAKGKAEFKGPSVKKREKFAPATKVEKPKKGAGSYDRKDEKKPVNENADIIKFIECIITKNYASANKYLNNAVELKIQQKIESEIETPLF
jgi:hypothetical protein